MKIGEMKESKYLKKEDVGTGVLATIARLEQQDVSLENDPAEMKYIMYFRESLANGQNKGMVLNWTNIQLCARVCGTEETDEWVGKKIELYDDPNVSFGGKLTGGIRIRAPQAVQPSENPVSENNPPPISDQDVPF